ncbi:anti-sigma factor family protein [Candidatus Solirubrobacter pratensis]|jgi:anti-sigma factor RsiW|uniref:anti-sigma factor family protein n=1 Tax=Candidatus Solirubrobacter pratensis TaxID=1298857 RepID=UPI00040D4A2B|nr:zf-HC2 domain-containing protein [Candidatus Solirubrobacter pratensis]
MTDAGLRCIEVVELVSAYIDDELDPQTRRRVEEHLELCPPCRVYVEQVRETVLTLGELPAGALSDQAVSELEAAFRAFSRGRA